MRSCDMVFCATALRRLLSGWGPKSDGIRRLSQELGLGLRDFVFIDDNPAEREEIRQTIPEIVVPEFPADPADLPAFGYDLGWRYFFKVALTEEDRSKTEQYRRRQRSWRNTPRRRVKAKSIVR